MGRDPGPNRIWQSDLPRRSGFHRLRCTREGLVPRPGKAHLVVGKPQFHCRQVDGRMRRRPWPTNLNLVQNKFEAAPVEIDRHSVVVSGCTLPNGTRIPERWRSPPAPSSPPSSPARSPANAVIRPKQSGPGPRDLAFLPPGRGGRRRQLRQDLPPRGSAPGLRAFGKWLPPQPHIPFPPEKRLLSLSANLGNRALSRS